MLISHAHPLPPQPAPITPSVILIPPPPPSLPPSLHQSCSPPPPRPPAYPHHSISHSHPLPPSCGPWRAEAGEPYHPGSRVEGMILRSQLLVLLQRRHFCDKEGRPVGREPDDKVELELEVRVLGVGGVQGQGGGVWVGFGGLGGGGVRVEDVGAQQ